MLQTIEELDKALANRKAPGADGIPPETLKTGKPALMQHLYELLCLCWKKGYVPQDMREAITVTLYKNKGDCSDCNNYRGISHLSIVGKPLLGFLSAACKSLHHAFTPSLSAALERADSDCEGHSRTMKMLLSTVLWCEVI